MKQAPALGLHPIPGAGPKAAGVEIGGGKVQVAVVAGHLSRERPQPLPHPGQEAVTLDLQGHHRDLPAGPQILPPGRVGPAQPALLSQGPGQGAKPRLGPAQIETVGKIILQPQPLAALGDKPQDHAVMERIEIEEPAGGLHDWWRGGNLGEGHRARAFSLTKTPKPPPQSLYWGNCRGGARTAPTAAQHR